MTKRVLFIFNPVAGTRRHGSGIKQTAARYFSKDDFTLSFHETRYAGDATEATREAVEQGVNIIVAVGGDGTINETGKALVNAPSALGVIPKGSGNGLARHLGIPLESNEAMKRIVQGKESAIDTLYINGKPCFNVAGIGFDAHVGYLFSTLPGRGLSSYIRATFKALLSFKPFPVDISSYETTLFKGQVFMVSMANSSQFGNNCYINPDGFCDDGKFELVLLLPFPLWRLPSIVYKLFTKKAGTCRYMKIFSTDKAHLAMPQPMRVHIDGEPAGRTNIVNLRIEPRSLKVVGIK